MLKKKHYYIDELTKEKVEITESLLKAVMSIIRAGNPNSPATYLHMIMYMAKSYDRKGQKIAYAYDEGLQVLENLGIDHADQMKKRLHELHFEPFYGFLTRLCENCGHPRGWHFLDQKCCDKGCDCDENRYGIIK